MGYPYCYHAIKFRYLLSLHASTGTSTGMGFPAIDSHSPLTPTPVIEPGPFHMVCNSCQATEL